MPMDRSWLAGWLPHPATHTPSSSKSLLWGNKAQMTKVEKRLFFVWLLRGEFGLGEGGTEKKIEENKKTFSFSPFLFPHANQYRIGSDRTRTRPTRVALPAYLLFGAILCPRKWNQLFGEQKERETKANNADLDFFACSDKQQSGTNEDHFFIARHKISRKMTELDGLRRNDKSLKYINPFECEKKSLEMNEALMVL